MKFCLRKNEHEARNARFPLPKMVFGNTLAASGSRGHSFLIRIRTLWDCVIVPITLYLSVANK